MGINGVPLHPLIVHAAVVFTPLAALSVIAFFARTPWRPTLRLPALGLAVVSALAILAAYISGKSFLGANRGLRQNPTVLTHEHRALPLLLVGIGFAVVAVVAVLLNTPRGPEAGAASPALATGAAALAVLLAVAVLVLVVVVGDAGARATWSGFNT